MVFTGTKILSGRLLEKERKKKEFEERRKKAAGDVEGLTPEGIPKAFLPQPSPFIQDPRITSGPGPAPTPLPKDFTFETDPRTGKLRFHGPGAAREQAVYDRTILRQEQKRVATEEAQRESEARYEKEQKAAGVLTKLGEEPQLTPEQLAAELEGLSIPENIKSALAGILAGTVSQVAVGAAGGAVVGSAAGGIGAGPGAAIGAVGFGVKGFVSSIKTEVKAEAGEDTSAINAQFAADRRTLGKVITAVNRGDIDPATGVRYFNEIIARIDKEERQMKQLTSTDLQDWLSGGSTVMAKIAAFNAPRGEKEVREDELRGAVIAPDPTKSLTEFEDLA